MALLTVQAGSKFSDVWIRNRLRIDFDDLRNEMLDDENIWKLINQIDAEDIQFDAVKKDLQMFIHGFELNAIMEPLARILWSITSSAGVRVLSPVLAEIDTSHPIERVIRSVWMLEVDPERGRDLFKSAVSGYDGSPLLRIVVASHLIWRVFWHHYKTVNSRHFVNSAKRALRPLGLAPAERRLENAKKGPNGT